MLPDLTPSELATGRWGYILPALGIDERFMRNRHGPCPMCGGKDRFRYDDKQGRGTWICNNCGAGDGYALLQAFHGWGFRQARTEVERIVGASPAPVAVRGPEDDEEKKAAAIRRVWAETEAVASGDPVWRYLNRRLGLEIIPACLRYHPALAYRHDDGAITHHPAMVAAVTYPDGKGATLHRTYLTNDGEKADVRAAKKLMPGKSLQSASIKLGGYSDALGIAEGIETALAASRRFSVPVWSCISSGLMEAWKHPDDVRRVLVFGDNDQKFGGQAAAYRIAHKLACAGVDVEVHIPVQPGTDWADV
jgi:putative DNA primase/helicase